MAPSPSRVILQTAQLPQHLPHEGRQVGEWTCDTNPSSGAEEQASPLTEDDEQQSGGWGGGGGKTKSGI